ncbi:hypothetical protein WOLCODRAFT_144225 [Wolfiporia cocos MD-104 SS10]|uniref:Uncharacterized protein n=1 Tax=Wolfiporia cocos (strain MD-104) TaxID=742152 RepID=A0A2H3JKU3_WOLCO|nr:hypothetical protein WOLCODRAFT_144225 [Wolfiporia cocos MD-104 SS10]
MSLLSASVPSLPALSRGTTSDGSVTTSSGLSSGLCTPDDVEIAEEFFVRGAAKQGFGANAQVEDELSTPRPGYVLDEAALLEDFTSSSISPSKPRPLSRALERAKKLAERTWTVRKSLRKKNSRHVMGGEKVTSSAFYQSEDDAAGSNNTLAQASPTISCRAIREMSSDAELSRELSNVDFDPDDSREEGLQAYSSDVVAGLRDISLESTLEEHLKALDELPLDSGVAAQRQPLTVRRLSASFLRLLLFLPWCVAVGGTIIVAPRFLEHVAFAPGYIRPDTGTRRFGFWADCGIPHIVIFLATLAALAWWDLRDGVAVAAAVAAGFMYAWRDFRPDFSVPLGSDDRQSIYLVVTKVYLKEGFVMRSSIDRKDTGNAGDVGKGAPSGGD